MLNSVGTYKRTSYNDYILSQRASRVYGTNLDGLHYKAGQCLVFFVPFKKYLRRMRQGAVLRKSNLASISQNGGMN